MKPGPNARPVMERVGEKVTVRATDIVVEVGVKFDYRMSETWRQQMIEDIQHAVLPLDEGQACTIKIKILEEQA